MTGVQTCALPILVLILSGVQILFFGLIGEYIARIFEESKRRPLYFFKQRPGDAEAVVAPRELDRIDTRDAA